MTPAKARRAIARERKIYANLERIWRKAIVRRIHDGSTPINMLVLRWTERAMHASRRREEAAEAVITKGHMPE